MKRTLRETCIDFFTDDHIKQDVREMMKPLFGMIYNEVYIYLWIIAFYHLFVVIMILSMFCILWRLMKQYEMKKRLMSNFVSHLQG
jgi:hypothetical protein